MTHPDFCPGRGKVQGQFWHLGFFVPMGCVVMSPMLSLSRRISGWKRYESGLGLTKPAWYERVTGLLRERDLLQPSLIGAMLPLAALAWAAV